MLKVVLELVNLDAQFLFLIRLHVDLFVRDFEILVILRVVLFELRFVLFEIN